MVTRGLTVDHVGLTARDTCGLSDARVSGVRCTGLRGDLGRLVPWGFGCFCCVPQLWQTWLWAPPMPPKASSAPHQRADTQGTAAVANAHRGLNIGVNSSKMVSW